ncbi:MAG: metal-dependent hydrolase [Myxococcaceae bacterium]
MKKQMLVGVFCAVAVFVSPGAALAQQGKAPAKAAGKTQATWWGHAAWILETPGGARIAIDPWLQNPKAPKDAKQPEALDAILVTHAHSDHVGNAQELAKRTGAPVYGSFELLGLIGTSDKDVAANIGGSFRVKDATITMVEAVHSSGYGQDPKNLKYGGPAMGYVIQIDNGPVLYHAGDTDAFSSMELIAERYKPTVALLPIGGYYTMDPNGAAVAARILKVKTVVPMHYGTFPLLKGTPEELTAALKKQRSAAKVQVATPGQPLTF